MQYDEGTTAAPNAADFVPIDSFDCSGIAAGARRDRRCLALCAVNGPGMEWKFVYPGLYNPAATPHQTGVFPSHIDTSVTPHVLETYDPNSSPNGANLTNVVKPNDPIASDAFNPWPAIQLSADDWPSFNKGVTNSPFGEFARNGDILRFPLSADIKSCLPPLILLPICYSGR